MSVFNASVLLLTMNFVITLSKQSVKCNVICLFTHGAPRSSQESFIPESNWNLEIMVFEERGKPAYPEKNLQEQRREPTALCRHITPEARFAKAPETFWARKAILSSSVSKNREVYTPETSCIKETSVHNKNI